MPGNDDYDPTIKTRGSDNIINFKDAVREYEQGVRSPGSHRELDPRKFHPSYIGCCKRQGFIRKTGIGDPDPESLGVFRAGTIIHEFYEHEISEYLPDNAVFEISFNEYDYTVETEEGEETITITGRADCVDIDNKVIYDFKSRGGWFYFDGFDQKNLDQLLLYMKGFNEQIGGDWGGKLVYINKKKPTSPDDVRPYPESSDDVFGFDPERFDELMQKAAEIKKAVESYVIETDDGYMLDKDKIRVDGLPFEPCDECYACTNGGERITAELRSSKGYEEPEESDD